MNNATKRRRKSDAKYIEREAVLISRLSDKEKEECFLYKSYCLNTDINDLPDEVWYDIPEWEGYYKLSNFIRLKSVRNNKIRKPRYNRKHYFDIPFHKDGADTYLIYSRIVASVFHPNSENLPEVNHKNGIRWDNRPKNLEWATGESNRKHAIEFLDNDLGKIEIVQLSMRGDFIKEWDSISNAAKSVNKPAANITSVCKNRNDYAYGFIWMYKDDYEKNGTKNRYIQKKYRLQ